MAKKELIIQGRTYFVSDDGEIYRDTGVRLAKHLRCGYEYVSIGTRPNRKKYSVHRLVCAVFHENIKNYPQVNHIDGNTRNNQSSNLEWIDASGNQSHSRYILGNQTGFKDTPVRCLETGEVYKSTRDAWRNTGANYTHISECTRGKRKSAGGFHWESAKDEVV